MTTRTETQLRPAFDLVLVKPGRREPQLQVHSDQNGSCSAQSPARAEGLVNVTPVPPSSRTGLQLPDFPCGSIGPIPASVPERGRIGGRAVTLERLANYITNPFTGVDRPVLDKTGLTGTFDFSVEWVLPRDGSRLGPALDNADPTFFEALEEQLGLTLKSTRVPIPILVVEHIERPSSN